MPKNTTNMPAALLVFAKPPVLGQVKTRLAHDIGQVRALAVYERLLQHTANITNALAAADVYVYWTQEPAPKAACRAWFAPSTQHRRQIESPDLGERMQAAFADMFQQNYRAVVIIGSDCPQIQTAHLDTAFAHLLGGEDNRAALGAAEDGGYYLLGLQSMKTEVFSGKQWSTSSVFADTLADLQAQQTNTLLLPTLRDIDTAADLE